MRICVISDASGMTNPAFPGHGLGMATHRIATGLLPRHDVTLIGAEGSVFAGKLVTPVKAGGSYQEEKHLAKAAYQLHKEQPFDAFLDNSHLHHLSDLFPDLPIVNVYHDIWQPEQRCAVLVSEAQKAMMRYEWSRHARVIHNTVDANEYAFNPSPDNPPYALFMGIVRDYKNPVLAIEACAKAGVKLRMAGTMHGFAPLFSQKNFGNTEYVGAVSGAEKVKLIQGASVFLQLGEMESFGLTTVEAGLCGVPVVALPCGGTVDIVRQGKNGAYIPVSGNKTQAIADSIEYAMTLDRQLCRDVAVQFGAIDRQIGLYEQALVSVARGERW